MQLIPLEEVIKILKLNRIQPEGNLPHIWHDISYIPTIDPISIIDKMIEESTKTLNFARTNALQELKTILLLTQK